MQESKVYSMSSSVDRCGACEALKYKRVGFAPCSEISEWPVVAHNERD